MLGGLLHPWEKRKMVFRRLKYLLRKSDNKVMNLHMAHIYLNYYTATHNNQYNIMVIMGYNERNDA